VNRLKFERTSRRLSQHEVSLRARIAQPVVSQIENGRLTPTPAQLQRLAAVCHVPADELLREVELLGPQR